jgi:hypothetical protein
MLEKQRQLNRKGGCMVKQDQNRSSDPNQARKQAHATPQGSHKQKARENLQDQGSQEGFMQGSKSEENRASKPSQKQRLPNDFDRNEGEGRSQKS